jgi:hypothetical protein
MKQLTCLRIRTIRLEKSILSVNTYPYLSKDTHCSEVSITFNPFVNYIIII